jgi:hypothetical protein
MAIDAIRIVAEGIYDDDSLYGALGISANVLARARRDASLRFTRKGTRGPYLGKWVLDWLEPGARQEGPNIE